jgi:beta-glucosidase
MQDLDIRFLLYGPPIHRTWLAHDRYDWDFADQTFGLLKKLNITA